MGSLGADNISAVSKEKAMWMYPKVLGAKPSERWGHSACFFNGLLYIFGGCRGGVHFSDVLVCDLSTMTWNILKTSGQGPGPRDSHSSVLVGHKIIVFGGTNGSKKVNDLHILDLLSREWTQPECRGNLPCARESHTANVIGDEKVVVFGGSGEGESNYLNDLHILDLKSMEWSSPEVRGSVPAPRDSHSSVAVGNRLFVFGGDSGDRYQRDLRVLDMNKLIWSRVDAQGPLPSARAGHASVSVGTKVYILGGVGDKQYYSDIWVLDAITCTWAQLDTCSRKSQGRFSHTATATNLGIAIFGGCGEDERPLNELLILQIDSLDRRASENMCKDATKMYLKVTENNVNTVVSGENDDLTSGDVEELEFIPEQSFRLRSDMLHPKRRRTSNSKLPIERTEHEEHFHSHSHSQQSSLSQSDHEQNPMKRSISNISSYPSSRAHQVFRQKITSPSNYHQLNNISRAFPDINLSSDHPSQMKQQHADVACNDMHRAHECKAAELISLEPKKFRSMIGAEVCGQVDGEFDSGYLMTATVNGKVFRGVLFAPGPDVTSRSPVLVHQPSHFAPQNGAYHANAGKSNSNFHYLRHSQQSGKQLLGPGTVHSSQRAQSRRLYPEIRAPITSRNDDPRANSELQGVVLTLASPGSDLGRP